MLRKVLLIAFLAFIVVSCGGGGGGGGGGDVNTSDTNADDTSISDLGTVVGNSVSLTGIVEFKVADTAVIAKTNENVTSRHIVYEKDSSGRSVTRAVDIDTNLIKIAADGTIEPAVGTSISVEDIMITDDMRYIYAKAYGVSAYSSACAYENIIVIDTSDNSSECVLSNITTLAPYDLKMSNSGNLFFTDHASLYMYDPDSKSLKKILESPYGYLTDYDITDEGAIVIDAGNDCYYTENGQTFTSIGDMCGELSDNGVMISSDGFYKILNTSTGQRQYINYNLESVNIADDGFIYSMPYVILPGGVTTHVGGVEYIYGVNDYIADEYGVVEPIAPVNPLSYLSIIDKGFYFYTETEDIAGWGEREYIVMDDIYSASDYNFLRSDDYINGRYDIYTYKVSENILYFTGVSKRTLRAVSGEIDLIKVKLGKSESEYLTVRDGGDLLGDSTVIEEMLVVKPTEVVDASGAPTVVNFYSSDKTVSLVFSKYMNKDSVEANLSFKNSDGEDIGYIAVWLYKTLHLIVDQDVLSEDDTTLTDGTYTVVLGTQAMDNSGWNMSSVSEADRTFQFNVDNFNVTVSYNGGDPLALGWNYLYTNVDLSLSDLYMVAKSDNLPGGEAEVVISRNSYYTSFNFHNDPNYSGATLELYLVNEICDSEGNCDEAGKLLKSSTLPFAQTYAVKRTGQTVSYANYDDGYYETGASRSYSRSNDIVKDNVTGLMWQDDAAAATATDTGVNAVDYCDSLSLGGYSDWRLPKLKELGYIANYSALEPAVDGVFVNVDTTSYRYWTYTESVLASDPSFWFIYFGNGNNGYITNSGSTYHDYFIRCVRTEDTMTVGSLARDDINNVVIDSKNDLMWQDSSAAALETGTWAEALSYCNNLNLLAHTDWRLPNINEIFSIVDYSKSRSSIHSSFQNVTSMNYWSSTTHIDDTTEAWGVDFTDGDNESIDKTSDVNHIRCVRDN